MIDIEKHIEKQLKKVASMINNRVRKPHTSVYIPSVILPMALHYLNETAISKLVPQYEDGSVTDKIYLISDDHLRNEDYSYHRLLITKYVHYLSDSCKPNISFEEYLIEDFKHEIEQEMAGIFFDNNFPDLFDHTNHWPEYAGYGEYISQSRSWLALNCLYLSYFHDGIFSNDEIVSFYIHSITPKAVYIEEFLRGKTKKLKDLKNTIEKIRVTKTASTYDLIFKSSKNTFIYKIPQRDDYLSDYTPETLEFDKIVVSNTNPPEYEGITLTDDGLTLLEMLKFDHSNYFEKEPLSCSISANGQKD